MSFENLIWIVPAVVLVAGAWRPRYGLVVFAAALPLFGSPPGGPYLGALDAAAVLAILTSLRAIHKHYPGEPDWRHSGLEWPVAAWVAVSLASMVPLVYQPPAWTWKAMTDLVRALPEAQSGPPLYTWRALANLLLGLGLFLAVRRAFAGRSLRPLGIGLAVGLGLTIVIGLGEFAGLFSLAGYRVIGDALYDSRLHSLFFHSGWLAEYLVLAVPFTAASLLPGGRWSRIAGLALLGLSVLTVVFTQQRGAWLAVLAQTLALPFVLSRSSSLNPRWRLVAAVLVVVLVASIGAIAYLRPEVTTPVIERLRSLSSDLSGRTALWGAAAELTKERPLLGWGLGSFASAYDQIHPPFARDSWRFRGTAHSLYFHVLAERGVLGLLALGALMWALLRGLREATATRLARYDGLGRGLTISLVGFLVYGLVQYVIYLKNIEFLSWLLLGAASLVMAGAPQGGARRLAQTLCLVALVLVPWRWIKVEPLEARFNRTFGFHELERRPTGGVMGWTEGRALRRVPWRGEVVSLDIVDGHPKAGARKVEVIVRAGDRVVWRGKAPNVWTTIDIDMGPPKAETFTLGFEVSPSFRPAFDYRSYPDLGPSRDIRQLGVVVSNLRWDEGPPIEDAEGAGGEPE